MQCVLHNLCVCLCVFVFVFVFVNVCVCVFVCLPVCSHNHSARNAHAPHNHLWPNPLYNIFQYYKRDDLKKKKVCNMKCVFRVSIHLSEIFFTLCTTERYLIQIVCRSACKEPDILVTILMRLQIYRKNLKKNIKAQSNENP